MGVVIHSSEPEGQPTGVGFQDGKPQFRKAFQYAGKNIMAESGHVIAGKSEGMIQPAQCQLDIFAPFAFDFPEGVKAALAILSMSGNWKIEFTSQVP